MSNYTIIKPKDRKEWLKHRSSGIGSSEIGTIFGLNPFETPLQLWRRKLGLTAPVEENEAMLMGHLLEDAVAQRYAVETGAQVINASQGDWLIVNNDKPYLRVSPDRVFWADGDKHNEANKRILECKTTAKQIDAEDLPPYWVLQLTYQLGVGEYYAGGALAWLHNGRQFGSKEIRYNPDLYAMIVDKVDEFYNKNILERIEPQPINVADLLIKHPVSNSAKVIASAEVQDACKRLAELKAQAKELETQAGECEELIKMAMGENDTLISEQGITLATWRSAKPSQKFDAKAFKSENPELAEKYTTEVPGTRRFLIK